MKNKTIKGISLLLLLGSFSLKAQTQIGSSIFGKAKDDWLGIKVAVSADGSIMAVGAPQNDTKGVNSGQVTVYKNNNGTWTKVGLDINGQWSYDTAGSSLAMSDDGNIVAIGSPTNTNNGNGAGQVRVFQNNNGTWTQLGLEIDGQGIGDNAGNSVALSSDGLTLAFGAYNFSTGGSTTGQARVFKYINGSWSQIGSDINGEKSNDSCGYSVSLSADGNTIAVTSVFASGELNDQGIPTSNAGKVRIFKNVNNIWTQVGNDILGTKTDYMLGCSTSISSNGNILAIGDWRNGTSGGALYNAGHVKLYQFINDTWTNIGPNFEGENVGDSLGQSVSISADGTVLAMAAPYNDGLNCTGNPSGGCNVGLIRVYQNVAGSWTSIGNDIYGDNTDDRLGIGLSLSDDGKKLVIGAPYANNGAITDSGLVKVYDLSPVLSTNQFVMDNSNFYPNPVKDQLYINLQNDLDLQEVNIFSITGQLIKTYNGSETIHMGQLAKGFYLVQIITDKGNATKKIRVE